MFSHLSISNYVLIQHLEIDFHHGLSIITGETGAGKSILLGALGLLTGQRADTSTLLDTTRKCIVEGKFNIRETQWKNWFEKHDLDYDPETVIRREITSDGKSRAFVNDSPVNLSILKELGAELIDIHSQHQNIYLESANFQLQILDTYAQQLDTLYEYNRVFSHYKKLLSELDQLRNAAKQSKSELDYHRFRFEELYAAKLQDGEQETLEEELKILTHAEEIKSGLSQVAALLEADEISVTQLLKSATSTLTRLQSVCSPAVNFLQRIESSLIELKDIAIETERIAEATEHDPARLEEVNARLDLLYALQQKHKVTSVKELIAIREELDTKIQVINHSDIQIEEIEKQINRYEEQLTLLAGSVSEKRRKSIPAIEEHIHTLLIQLGIPNALFKVELLPSEQFTPSGTDIIRFLFSANKQQNLQELGKVASGGEVSRLMLSIKAAIAEKILLPTLIFDEIDSGVSGKIAEKMGNILEQMSQYAQIINITHLPQVAAKGSHHYKVFKEDQGSVTQTKVQELSFEERVTEIAKMLSGEKVTEAAIENAKHLLGAL
ncbi:MAG: DNA repair protein RecN [Bacteroidales bacterium]|jgi:DNA repair protein RecN (Recombination protein N)|nr:DNA repair protein RecN [Bacteroidales bacterium]